MYVVSPVQSYRVCLSTCRFLEALGFRMADDSCSVEQGSRLPPVADVAVKIEVYEARGRAGACQPSHGTLLEAMGMRIGHHRVEATESRKVGFRRSVSGDPSRYQHKRRSALAVKAKKGTHERRGTIKVLCAHGGARTARQPPPPRIARRTQPIAGTCR